MGIIIKNCNLFLLFWVLVLSSHSAFAQKPPSLPIITEDNISRYVANAYVSEKKGLIHPDVALYASTTGINLAQVVSVLKISTQQKENTPISFGLSSRYGATRYSSATTKIFEVVRVKVKGKRKILVLYNTQSIDMYDIETFHKGWQLAELSDKYNLEKLHNFFHITKHPWPGGEAIYTDMRIKKNNLIVTLTYEQNIRGYELYTECNYLFFPSAKGTLLFKKVIEIEKDGPK